MNNLKRRIEKIEQSRATQQIVVVIVNDIELQGWRYQGLPHEPFVTYANGCKIIHCLEGQNIDGL